MVFWIIVFSPILLLLIFALRSYFSKAKVINGCPTISFKEFLTYYNNAPEKWAFRDGILDDIRIYYCTREICLSSDYEYHKFNKWQEAQRRSKKYDKAMKELKYLKEKWAEDMNKVDSYKTELAEAEAAAKYWEDLYNQIVKENKKHD